MFGGNSIDIEGKSVLTILLDEVSSTSVLPSARTVDLTHTLFLTGPAPFLRLPSRLYRSLVSRRVSVCPRREDLDASHEPADVFFFSPLPSYYYYAFAIALISVSSILQTLFETKRVSQAFLPPGSSRVLTFLLRQTIERMREMSRFSCDVQTLIDGECTLSTLFARSPFSSLI